MKNDFPLPPKGQEKKIAFNYTPPLKKSELPCSDHCFGQKSFWSISLRVLICILLRLNSFSLPALLYVIDILFTIGILWDCGERVSQM